MGRSRRIEVRESMKEKKLKKKHFRNLRHAGICIFSFSLILKIRKKKLKTKKVETKSSPPTCVPLSAAIPRFPSVDDGRLGLGDIFLVHPSGRLGLRRSTSPTDGALKLLCKEHIFSLKLLGAFFCVVRLFLLSQTKEPWQRVLSSTLFSSVVGGSKLCLHPHCTSPAPHHILF